MSTWTKFVTTFFSDLPRICAGDNLVERATYTERIPDRGQAWYEDILQTHPGDLDWPGHCHANIRLLGVPIKKVPFYANGYVSTETMCKIFENPSWDYDICRLVRDII